MSGDHAVIGFFAKRDLLHADPPSAAALVAAGERELAGGRLETALELFLRAGDQAAIAKALEAARAGGDAFSFEAALRALGRPAQPPEWVEVGETALGQGKLWFAYRAFEKADNQEALERTRRAMSEAGITPPS